MESLISFLLGVACSAVIAWIVYRRQKREALETEAKLLLQLSQTLRAANLSASTAVLNLRETTKLEEDVQTLRHQLRNTIGNDSPSAVQLPDFVELSYLWTSGELSIENLRHAHRAVLSDNVQLGGKIREVDVVVGQITSASPEGFKPSRPETIEADLSAVINEWNQTLKSASSLSEDEKWSFLAHFHHRLLEIHPFLDGNGSLARSLLATQAKHLLGVRLKLPRDSQEYRRALCSANNGDLAPLVKILKETADMHVESD